MVSHATGVGKIRPSPWTGGLHDVQLGIGLIRGTLSPDGRTLSCPLPDGRTLSYPLPDGRTLSYPLPDGRTLSNPLPGWERVRVRAKKSNCLSRCHPSIWADSFPAFRLCHRTPPSSKQMAGAPSTEHLPFPAHPVPVLDFSKLALNRPFVATGRLTGRATGRSPCLLVDCSPHLLHHLGQVIDRRSYVVYVAALQG